MQYQVMTDDHKYLYVRCWTDPTDVEYVLVRHEDYELFKKGKLKVETNKIEKEGR